jgi:hypothetical protein
VAAARRVRGEGAREMTGVRAKKTECREADVRGHGGGGHTFVVVEL